jgi:hypothetical protein
LRWRVYSWRGLLAVGPLAEAEHGVEKDAGEDDGEYDCSSDENSGIVHFGGSFRASRKHPRARIDGTQIPTKIPLSRPSILSCARKYNVTLRRKLAKAASRRVAFRIRSGFTRGILSWTFGHDTSVTSGIRFACECCEFGERATGTSDDGGCPCRSKVDSSLVGEADRIWICRRDNDHRDLMVGTEVDKLGGRYICAEMFDVPVVLAKRRRSH